MPWKHYNNDPFWLYLKYPGKCSNCLRRIKPSERAFYFPADRSMMCTMDDCGEQASRDFNAAVFDEAMLESQHA